MSDANDTNNVADTVSPFANLLGAKGSARRWTIGFAIAYAAATIATVGVAYRLQQGYDAGFFTLSWTIVSTIAAAILFFGTVLFVQVFTTPILEAQKGKAPPRTWFVFSYAFMLLSLFGSTLPFVLPSNDLANRGNPDRIKVLGERPIAVFRGCVDDLEDAVPEELRCNTPAQGDKTQQPKADGDKTKVPHAMWIINIGGQLEETNKDICGEGCHPVRGGLVVPLYVVILALIGGAISLTRRVPEYQKQADPDFRQTEVDYPKLELYEVRENLVFQIVQYASAPFIAVAAYYVIKPSDTSTSVALAFIAGFASEIVLLMIRGAVQKVMPKPEKLVGGPLGSVRVHVEDDTGKPVEGATVRVIGQAGFTAKTDNEGSHTFDQVPVGEHAIEAAHNDKTKIQVVAVSSGHSVDCNIKT